MWKRVKSGVQGRVARFRVPGGAEPVEAASDERPMPIAASILWKPIEGAAGQDAGLFPVFITQRVLAAVHDHCAATPAACFGLLIGDVVDSPETGASHVVVESTIRLPASPDDDAKTVLVQGWVVAQDVLRKSGDLLVGWYRGGGREAALSPAEADAHRAFFVQPWQLAVVVGSGDTTVGAVLRRSASSGWAQECLPFYELVDPASSRPDGSKPTRLRWVPGSGGGRGPQTRSPWRSPRSTCVRDCSPAARCGAPSWGVGSSWSKNAGRPTTACGRKAGRRSIPPARPGTGRFIPMSTASSGGSNARPAPDRDARRRFARLPRERSAVSGDDAGVAAAA